MRIMLDTMVFDHIVAAEGLVERLDRAQRQGVLTLLTTEVQEEQLRAAPEAKRRSFRVIRRLVVPAAEDEGAMSDDEIIAASALQHAEVLVTEDRELRQSLQSRPFPVWTFRELREFVS